MSYEPGSDHIFRLQCTTFLEVQGQLRDEAESHAEHLAELERQTAAERKQWRSERAQLINERDGFCGQVPPFFC